MEQFQEHAHLRVVDADAKPTATKGDAVTPERIALMRENVVHDADCPEQSVAMCGYDCIYSNLDEALDEVVRLRKLVAAHVVFDWHDNAWGGLAAMCRGCGAVNTTDNCEVAKDAHVATILDGPHPAPPLEVTPDAQQT